MQFFHDDTVNYGEVQFFFQARVQGNLKTLAVVSVYSPPNPALLEHSYNTLWACQYRGEANLEVIDVQNILSVVALIPLPARAGYFFVGEKLGLEVTMLGGFADDDPDGFANDDLDV